ncbi:hypothetical protein BV20DRAFT_679485 [Pilatotrama ljubarskyi]|nr:hypothetical protein BV20DRAFT_679485 [Pilatotrama ljubarskyi]
MISPRHISRISFAIGRASRLQCYDTLVLQGLSVLAPPLDPKMTAGLGISEPYVLYVLALLLSSRHVWAQRSSCPSKHVGWYTGLAHETPCKTYETLLQQCNDQTATPDLSALPSVDICAPPFKLCCCNSAAYILSMLCLNCNVTTSNTIRPINSTVADLPSTVYFANCSQTRNGSDQAHAKSLLANITKTAHIESTKLDFLLQSLPPDGSW